MREEELINKLESVELPEIQLESHRSQLRMALLDAGYLKERPTITILGLAKSKVEGGIDMIRGLVSRQPVWACRVFIAVPVAAILLTLLLLQPLVPSLGPQGVMAAAHAATAGLQSYRMSGSSTCIRTCIIFGEEISETAFEMKFAAPDRFHAKITIGGALLEFIVIGDKQYVREPDRDDLGEGVVTEFAFVPLDILRREWTLKLLGSLTDLERLPDEKIDGVYCFRYRGRVDEPGPMEIEVELWIGKDDYLIRQMKVNQEEGSEDNVQWGIYTSIVRYYDFNAPIEIEPPKTACGELLPGWRLGDWCIGCRRESALSADVTFTINRGDDPSYYQIISHITITNAGEREVTNLEVVLSTLATHEAGGWTWVSPELVTLEPGESETFYVTWQCDARHVSKEELSRLVHNSTFVLADHTTPEGEWAVQPLFPRS